MKIDTAAPSRHPASSGGVSAGRPEGKTASRGSALVTVLIFSGVLLMITWATLKLSLSERRFNNRSAYWIEARAAAEALAEYGFAQVRNQFEAQATPPTFKPGSGNALVLPPTSFFSGGKVDTTAYSSSHTTGLELIGGPASYVPATAMYYIDPNDPNNQYDPMKGLWIVRRDIVVLAQASVVPPSSEGPPVTAYISETISVRGAPLFAHAIFYAKDDLEIFPGPQMDVYGPVHSNGNIFVSGQSSSAGLTFHGTVSATGAIFHAWSNVNNASHGSGSETLGQNPVKFVSADGTTTKSLNLTGTSTGWMDSTTGLSNGVSGLSNLQALITPSVTSTFRQAAVKQWGGNLQTGAMGVQTYNPIAFNEVIGTDSSGNPITADPHTLVEPPAPPATTDTYYSAKEQIEQQKYSTQAKLYVKITLSDAAAGAAPTATIQLYGVSKDGSAGAGPNGYVALTNPVNMSTGTNPLVAYKPYSATKTTVGAKLTSGTYKNQYPITTAPVSSTGTGTSSTTYSTALPAKASGGTVSAGASDTWVNTGLYDQRRQMGVDLVELDAGALRAAVQDMASGTNDNNAIRYSDGTVYDKWNGAVYVEINDTSTRGNTGNQAGSVRLVNGKVTTGSLMPTYGDNGNGLTIATNSPLYILGNFNADGSVSSASATTPDDGHTGAPGDTSAETPVCIAADAITILTPTWQDKISADTTKQSSSTNTEVAAAFLTGLVPTSNTASSGGAHNFPRFLENLGCTIAIRGSLVAMFQSKIATQAWSTAFYGAPTRVWGFDTIFQNGTFPPLTPKVLSFRRVNFNMLSPSGYSSARSSLWP